MAKDKDEEALREDHMDTKKSKIGVEIICSNLGVGEIVDVLSLKEGGEMFYKVNFSQNKCINYFSVSNQKNYRILSSKEKVEKAIRIFKSKYERIEYGTTQEKINFQKELLNEKEICILAKTLAILNSEEELHAQVTKQFKSSLKSFIDEIKFVMKLSEPKVKSILGIKDKAKK